MGSRNCPNERVEQDRGNGFRRGNNQPGPGDTCFNCGGTGHWSKECPSGKRNDESLRGVKCYNCGKFGHKATDCGIAGGNRSNVKRGPMKCYKCGEMGHKANECGN